MGRGAVDAAEAFYTLRGEDYFVNFKRGVDLPAFEQVLTNLENSSLTSELPEICWSLYDAVVEYRKSRP
jgi:hypothetical protein